MTGWHMGTARRTVMSVLAASIAVVMSVGAIGVAAAAPTGSSGGNGSSTGSAGVDTSFYTPPSGPLPAPGTLLKTAPMSTFITVPSAWGRVPARATLIMYVTTDALGHKTAVSGYYLQPARAWKGPGPRPLVSYAPGAHGQGDQCAPSRVLQSVTVSSPGGPMAEIESLITYNLVAKGYGVVSTDYIGLGTPGVHTFGIRVDQANAVIDAARAALTLPNVDPHTKVALAGYSQGGAATAAAAEIIDDYAPELRKQVVGIYAGGAPTNLRSLLDYLDGNRLGGAIAWAINGATARYPEIATLVPGLLNAEGKRVMASTKDQCIVAVSLLGAPKTSSWTASGKKIGEIIDENPALAKRVDEQRVGMLPPTSIPILLSANPVDPTVPKFQGDQLYGDWCAKNPASLEYRYIRFPVLGGTPLGHIAGGVAGFNEAFGWLADRFAGKRAVTGCVKAGESNGSSTGSAGSS